MHLEKSLAGLAAGWRIRGLRAGCGPRGQAEYVGHHPDPGLAAERAAVAGVAVPEAAAE